MNASNDTFQHCIESGETIYVFCASSHLCSHSSKLDLHAMAAKYGLDHGALHADLVKLAWRCEKCGGRKVSFRYQPGKKDYTYWPPNEIPESKRIPGGDCWKPSDETKG
jgi:hypothetical protein